MRAKFAIATLLLSSLSLAQQTPTLPQALASPLDLWGQQSLQQPDGPSYDFFAKLLPPLRYVNTQFKYYPIPLAAPLSPAKARLVSNGSGINLPTGTDGKIWYDFPLAAQILIGSETFGADPSHLTGPTYDLGYLPIVHLQYQSPAGAVAEDVFVPAQGPLADHGAALVRLSSLSDQPLPITLHLTSSTPLQSQNHLCTDPAGRALLWLNSDWTARPAQNQVTATLPPGKSLLFAVFSKPLESPSLPELNDSTYQSLRTACSAEWQSWLSRCMNLQLPEDRVNRAWKSTLIANLMMATGDQMNYSAGNVYQRTYQAESGDAIDSLLQFGLTDLARRMTLPMLSYQQHGLDYHDAAFKLQLLSHLYWLTRDSSFIQSHENLWRPAVNLILQHREKSTGLLPKENYCADINTQVYTLNSNANSWRGLHDIAAVLRDIGQSQQAADIESPASQFRASILAALDKSIRTDVTPPFIPIALFGAEKPYDHLSDTKLGSYWDLMIPYVLGSGILSDSQTQAALDYLHSHGGICMGMIRFHQHSGLFANENGLDDLYGLRYTQTLLLRDDVDHALISFYGKLAQGLTPDTFIGGEGSSLLPLDPLGRPMYLPPNASGNAFFLSTLRNLLIQDPDLDHDGSPDTLRLLFATPRQWLADNQTILIQNAPTSFGPISLTAHSHLSTNQLTVDITPPTARLPKQLLLRLRLPTPYKITSATLNNHPLQIDPQSTITLPPSIQPFTIHVKTAPN